MSFDLLPIEVNALIATHLSDQDITFFARLCRSTRNAVYCDRSPLWRSKFAQHYDLVPGTGWNNLKTTYQWRRKILRRNVKFAKGVTPQEKQCLYTLRDLILESFATTVPGEESKNIQVIEAFAKSSDILKHVCLNINMDGQNPLLAVIQLMLSHLRFHPELHGPALGWEDTQQSMYSTVAKEPIFKGKRKVEINLPWVLRAVNFFKHHFASDENPEIYDCYSDLAALQKIKAWRKPLRGGVHTLGKHWKGAYAYLEQEELPAFREIVARSAEDDYDETGIYLDKFHGEDDEDGTFQSLALDFAPRAATRWPMIFEQTLKSLSHPSAMYLQKEQKQQEKQLYINSKRTTRAQHRNEAPVTEERSPLPNLIDPKPVSFNFQGSGHDGDKFYAAGWLNPLPAQQGIPGWMRWTMMKFFVDGEEGGGNEPDEPFAMNGNTKADPLDYMDTEALWAYEGVVLPGGEIVVGRWWSPDADEYADEQYSGPFILWCVDE